MTREPAPPPHPHPPLDGSLTTSEQSPVERLLAIMAKLRDPDTGCAWDVAQTFETIAPYTIEEAYEVADAVARCAMDDLRDELGDLLLQVVFHARMAEEAGSFAFADVCTAIADKMERRHPHVFGPDSERRGSGHDAVQWEQIKIEERGRKGHRRTLDGVAIALPALDRADKLQRRAAATGFDWPDATGARNKVAEEMAEVDSAVAAAQPDAIIEEVGDLLFAVVNWARKLGVRPEEALRAANAKFERRFNAMEDAAGKDFTALDLDAKERLWQRAKADER